MLLFYTSCLIPSLLLFVSQVVVCYQFTIIWWFPSCFRNSHQRCSIKKTVFHNIHWKITPALESLFNKVVYLRTANLLKRDSNTGVLNIAEFSANGWFEVVFIKMISCGIDKSFKIRSWFLQSWQKSKCHQSPFFQQLLS